MIESRVRQEDKKNRVFWLEQLQFYLGFQERNPKHDCAEMIALCTEMAEKLKKRIDANSYTKEQIEFWEWQTELERRWEEIKLLKQQEQNHE